jgi:hypothetical protein
MITILPLYFVKLRLVLPPGYKRHACLNLSPYAGCGQTLTTKSEKLKAVVSGLQEL